MGSQGITLRKKRKLDSEDARDAFAKLHKTIYNWGRSKEPQFTAWQKKVFEIPERAMAHLRGGLAGVAD